jgi:AcrR family transcriptional regulator
MTQSRKPPAAKKGAVNDRRLNLGRRQDMGDLTRVKIIDVAERLFAENGVDAVSLRTVMTAAKVSISLINYHFGTKQGLLRAIFEKRAIPLTQERLRMIDEAKEENGRPDLEDLLRAFVLPGLRAGIGKKGKPNYFDRLLGRIAYDPSEGSRSMMREFFDPFQARFVKALRASVPELSEEDAYWRLHCLLGVVMYTATNPHRIYELSGGLCDIRDVDKAFDRILPILIAAIRAPERSSQMTQIRKRAASLDKVPQ